MALREAVRRRRCWGAGSSRSRITSDFEIFRTRDSASISAARGSGNRTVRVFTGLSVLHLCRVCKTASPDALNLAPGPLDGP